MAQEEVNRRSDRIEVNAEVALRRSGHPQGPGTTLVKFDRLEAIEGVVCWTEGFQAGIQYDKPMHPAVFEMLLPRLT